MGLISAAVQIDRDSILLCAREQCTIILLNNSEKTVIKEFSVGRIPIAMTSIPGFTSTLQPVVLVKDEQ